MAHYRRIGFHITTSKRWRLGKASAMPDDATRRDSATPWCCARMRLEKKQEGVHVSPILCGFNRRL